jgi:hypothetical protein
VKSPITILPKAPVEPSPSPPASPREAAAKDAGLDVALIDHDALVDLGGAQRAVAHAPNAGGTAVYRGWMLRADQYAALTSALEAKGVTLLTSADQYRRAHELAGWHAALTPVTPQAEWTTGDGEQGGITLGA